MENWKKTLDRKKSRFRQLAQLALEWSDNMVEKWWMRSRTQHSVAETMNVQKKKASTRKNAGDKNIEKHDKEVAHCWKTVIYDKK